MTDVDGNHIPRYSQSVWGMMGRMGYRKWQGLGSRGQGRIEPVGPTKKMQFSWQNSMGTRLQEDHKEGSVEDSVAQKGKRLSDAEIGKAFSKGNLDMSAFLKQYSLDYGQHSTKPRGLCNKNNSCFVNAILQALLACPPYYNLMKSLPKESLGITQ